jgi:ketosteroid isomerase-like protein
MNLEEVVEQYHRAADSFSRGNPEPVKALFSRRDDVALANPFGHAVRGWDQVSEALDFASSRFRDGQASNFDNIASYVGADLASILEIEWWKAKVGDRDDVTRFQLRVSSTFRQESGSWKLVHRHADPIATVDSDGPMRDS